VIEEGTADELKDRIGGRSLEVEIVDGSRLEDAAEVMRRVSGASVVIDQATRTVGMPVAQDTDLAARTIAELSGAGIPIRDFHLQRPSLDDVFLALTKGTTPPGQHGETGTASDAREAALS
jgi:ABC-2 type transport system ATP-binding protein